MRPISRLLLPLTGLALVSGLACKSMTDTSTGGGGNPDPSNVSIVSGAQTLGHHAFSPDTFSVSLAAGGRVKWGNHDTGMAYGDAGVTHRLADIAGTEFTSPNITPGATFVHVFTAEGTYNYHCQIHPSMQGTVIVTP